jgi:hypothetical protein
MKDPANATILHYMVKLLKLKDRLLTLILQANSGSGNKPNIMFNLAMKAGDMLEVKDFLHDAGYLPKDTHLVWVLVDKQEAIKNNLERERVAPLETLKLYHKIVRQNITDIINNNRFDDINGEMYVILNKRIHTDFYKVSNNASNPKYQAIKGFNYVWLKKRGGKITSKEALTKYKSWVKMVES